MTTLPRARLVWMWAVAGVPLEVVRPAWWERGTDPAQESTGLKGIFRPMEMPLRPEPPERVLDFDDGCAYSCAVAGTEEDRLQNALLEQVRDCLKKGLNARLKRHVHQDYAGVRTALYDLWREGRQHEALREFSNLAAEKTAELGDTSLRDFDKKHPPRF